MKMCKSFISLLSATIALVLVTLSAGGAGEPDPQQAAITKTAQAFVDAYQKGDADACAAFWTPDGDYTDLGGRVLKGRKAITEDFADLFAENKGLKLRIEVASVRFPTPDTAIEDGVTSVMSADGALPNRAHYTNFLVKKDGQWMLSSVHESPYVPPSNYEHLRPLEWAIGEWVEDVKDGPAGRVFFEWSPDHNFIIETRAVGVKDELLDNGSQRIGWDAAAKTIRSWSFESDGGFGEGTWGKDGDKWVIKMGSILNSGSVMTSTNIVTRVDADTITVLTKDQKVDGKNLPDAAAITMKRIK